tara:strand:+ start:217 stop:387 length:171 start_codon:yes stop_codon:yes gene_type:complete
MKKIVITICFLLSACSTKNDNNMNNKINFSKDMKFEEFGIKLKVYADRNPYPNIDD